MSKRIDEPPSDLDHADYLKASEFAFDFQRGLAITLVGIKDSVPLQAGTFDVGKIDNAATWIEKYNTQEYNIYFHVNELKPGAVGKKAKKSDIVSVSAFHVDVDDPSDEALQSIAAFTLKPSIILFSGGGYQAFWLLNEPLDDLDLAEAINAGLADHLGGDSCQNVDRIMRVPNTINWPNTKKRKAGRQPAAAYLLNDSTDFARKYSPKQFSKFRKVSSRQLVPSREAALEEISLISIDDLGLSPDDPLAILITSGDDPKAPRGGENPRFPSRSEAYFSVCCTLARRGTACEVIAGVIANPINGISEAILEKPRPLEFAFRQATKAIALTGDGWPDATQKGNPRMSYANALVGLMRMKISFEYDAFKNRKHVGGHQLNDFQGDLTDDAAAMLRKSFLDTHGFDPGKNYLLDAVQVLCLEERFHPIRDYLSTIIWDKNQRLETWLVDYMGAEDTPLNRAIGKLMLVAGVRRIKQPGIKFDTMVVLEGIQGSGKSTAISILAGDGNFSDQNVIALDDKAQMEALEGVWLFEVAELGGMSHADVSKIKAFISRTEDRGRPAYARFKESWPRQCILIGTTNDDFYLKDQTGNRRFWPVKTGQIDLEKLRIDRNQLWAEAVELEVTGFPIELPRDLWGDAAAEQAERMLEDPWLDVLSKVAGTVRDGIERVGTETLFGEAYLNIAPAQRQSFQPKRIAGLMRNLGWSGPKKIRVEVGKAPLRGYERPTKKPDTPEF